MAKKKAAARRPVPRKKIARKLTNHEKTGRKTMRANKVYDTYMGVIGLLSSEKPTSLAVLRARLTQAMGLVDEAIVKESST